MRFLSRKKRYTKNSSVYKQEVLVSSVEQYHCFVMVMPFGCLRDTLPILCLETVPASLKVCNTRLLF